jgi:hypothetical protein
VPAEKTLAPDASYIIYRAKHSLHRYVRSRSLWLLALPPTMNYRV